MVEADRGLDQVDELLADVDPAVEAVALRPNDPDVSHARIMSPDPGHTLVTSGYVSASARSSIDRMKAVFPSV